MNVQNLLEQLGDNLGTVAGESLRTLNHIAAWLNELRTTRPDVFAPDGTLLPDYAERLQQAPPEPQVLPLPDEPPIVPTTPAPPPPQASAVTVADLLSALDAAVFGYVAWREGSQGRRP